MKQKSIIFLILLTILFSCERETQYDLPVVFTGEVTPVDQNKAILNAKIYNPNNAPIIESGFIWGVHSMDKNDILILNPSIQDNFSLQTNYDLLPNKTYYTRAFIKTNHATVYGREVSFRTDSIPINPGKWTKIIDNPFQNNEYINCGFTFNDITYFVLQYGDIYRYNHLTKKMDSLMSNKELMHSSFACTFQNNAYIFAHNAFYKLNLTTYEFTKLKEWGAIKRYGCSGFILNDEIFIGLGGDGFTLYSKEVWKYNISSDIWSKIEDFPGEYRLDAFSFTLNGFGYFGGGYNMVGNKWPLPKFNDLWSYDPITNKWQRKENLPIMNRNILELPGTGTSNFGYCVYRNVLWEYNPTFNLWEKMQHLSETEEFVNPFMFSYKNKVYIIEAIEYGFYDPIGFKLYMYEK